MKQDSRLFDSIRIKKSKGKDAPGVKPGCDHPGCKNAGEHRAPKGRGKDKEYWRFCLEHVREYNNTYNYFSGLPDEAVASFQKSAATGHRPTWSMGTRGKGKKRNAADIAPDGQTNPWAEAELPRQFADPFGLLHGKAGHRAPEQTSRRPVGNAERKAFSMLNLEVTASASEIKLRFKAMVKRFHPDANGGDKTYEDKLREIIQAYTQLEDGGFLKN